RRRHKRFSRDWSSDVCSSDLSFERENGRQREGGDDRRWAGRERERERERTGKKEKRREEKKGKEKQEAVEREGELIGLSNDGNRSEERRVGKKDSSRG